MAFPREIDCRHQAVEQRHQMTLPFATSFDLSYAVAQHHTFNGVNIMP